MMLGVVKVLFGKFKRTSSSVDIVLTRDEIVELIEVKAQRKGMTAAQLLSYFRQGRLDDPGDVGDALILADLLPEDDPLFVAG
jgi:hypothetical protein